MNNTRNFRGIVDFINDNKAYINRWYNNNIPLGKINSDVYFLRRAGVLGNIPKYKTHHHNNHAEYLIHKMIWELQEEFINYDLKNAPVWMWYSKRCKNTLHKINRIRQTYWYFKPISTFIK